MRNYIEYKGFYIEHGTYAEDEFTVQYCGDDFWFESEVEAKIFIDEITEEN